jgi:hypothetical protein
MRNIKERTMLTRNLFLFCLFVSTLVLSGCASITEQQLIADGATPLSGEQTRAHLAGKTEKWPYYETYYSPDGKVEALWDKVMFRGTWEVSADGKVCLNGKKWNNVCHSYLNNDGAITRIEGGLSGGVKETVEGKKLSR